ncbi:tetratricopeptide repeat protein, partial [Striga asiatica]
MGALSSTCLTRICYNWYNVGTTPTNLSHERISFSQGVTSSVPVTTNAPTKSENNSVSNRNEDSKQKALCLSGIQENKTMLRLHQFDDISSMQQFQQEKENKSKIEYVPINTCDNKTIKSSLTSPFILHIPTSINPSSVAHLTKLVCRPCLHHPNGS